MRGEDAAHEAQRTDMVLYMFFLFLFLFSFLSVFLCIVGASPFYFFFLPLTGGPSLPKPFPPLPGMPLLGLQPTCAYGGVWEDIVTYGFFYHSVLVYTYSQTHAPSPLRPLTELWSHAPLGESRSRAE